MILPSLNLTETYTSNVSLDADDETSDFVTLIQPEVAIRSGWSVHSLELATGAEIAFHADESDENYEDVFARANARIDIRRATTLDISGDIARLHVGRDDPDDDDGDELVAFLSYGSAIRLNQEFNRLSFRADIGFDRDDFDDEEDDRDVFQYDFGLRPSYRLGRGFGVFVEGRYNIEDRDQDIDDSGLKRDSQGYEIQFGFSQEISALFSGEAFIGYRHQQFDEPTFDDESGLSFGADLDWLPTQLTTISLAGRRDLEATDQADAASNFRTSANLSVAHELRRNISLNASLGYTRSDFTDDDRKDDTIDAGLGVTYRMNRWIGLSTGYGYSQRFSTDDDQDFRAQSVRVGLALQL